MVRFRLFAVITLCVSVLGCGSGSEEKVAEKKPRPVEVQVLRLEEPPSAKLVSASVGSWKTEEIGFEVSGRIEWVAEPNTDIEGRVLDGDGNTLVEGTPVAQVESERLQLQVDTAIANVESAVQSVNAATIELERSIPSQIRAAEAEKTLAETEFLRSKRLFEQDAGAKSDVDRDEANYQTAISKIEQLEATTKAKNAELESLRLGVEKARQALRDARRSLSDSVLYSSFRGQIADVAVVPGSVVTAGQPVATVQMMDPIKIEVEVSAEDSRRLRQRQRIPVKIPVPNGEPREEDGFLYLVDPVADPLTRTFTLTLLMLNERHSSAMSGVAPGTPVTDQAWRLDFGFLPGAEEGANYVVEEALHKDDKGHFLWRIDNLKVHESLPSDGLIKVSKVRVKAGDSKLPFLGNWIFQQIEILDDSFNSEEDLVAGKLIVTEGEADDWDGDTILVDRTSQWMVRPGDIVQVNLSDEETVPGYYVPMDAVAHEAGRNFLYLVESGDKDKVVRTEINVIQSSGSGSTSSMLRVEPTAGQTLEGKSVVTRGVHYLRDGEPVRVTRQEGDSQ